MPGKQAFAVIAEIEETMFYVLKIHCEKKMDHKMFCC